VGLTINTTKKNYFYTMKDLVEIIKTMEKQDSFISYVWMTIQILVFLGIIFGSIFLMGYTLYVAFNMAMNIIAIIFVIATSIYLYDKKIINEENKK
jgi:carbon starvation protein CstA